MDIDRWRKSSFSGGTNGDCVELRVQQASSSVRDSKAPGAGTLTLGASEFRDFLAAVRT